MQGNALAVFYAALFDVKTTRAGKQNVLMRAIEVVGAIFFVEIAAEAEAYIRWFSRVFSERDWVATSKVHRATSGEKSDVRSSSVESLLFTLNILVGGLAVFSPARRRSLHCRRLAHWCYTTASAKRSVL